MYGKKELSILQMKVFMADMALVAVGIVTAVLVMSTFRIVKRREGYRREMKSAEAGLPST